jgi:hypothetical protein
MRNPLVPRDGHHAFRLTCIAVVLSLVLIVVAVASVAPTYTTGKVFMITKIESTEPGIFVLSGADEPLSVSDITYNHFNDSKRAYNVGDVYTQRIYQPNTLFWLGVFWLSGVCEMLTLGWMMYLCAWSTKHSRSINYYNED